MFVRNVTTTFAAALCAAAAHAQNAAIAPKFLVDPNKPADVAKQVAAQGDVTVKAEGGKLVYTVEPGGNDWPGAGIHAVDGKPWDLSPWGHIEAKVTNTGNQNISIGLRVDDSGGWQNNNAENFYNITPGQSIVAKVIFGYQYGYQKGFNLNKKSVAQVLIYLHGKGDAVRTFTVEDLMANGPAGEKPVDPNAGEELAKNGNIFGPGARFDAAKQLAPTKATANVAGGKIQAEFEDGGFLKFTPNATRFWNFKWGNAVAVTLKNTGAKPVTPKLQAASEHNTRTDLTPLEKPLAPGATATFHVSFVPEKPWVAEVKGGGHNGHAPGTGTKFESTKAEAVYLFADAGAKLEIAAVTLAAPPANLPAWLGKQPPVPQAEWKNWKLTFNENFDKPLDPKVWNVYTDNFWDKRTHFTKDNNIVKNGKMTLKYEKKTGFHCDDPNDTFGNNGQTDYACGHADTYGKWTQRYGYFEARMKLPTANGLWPAFWTSPDRGIAAGPEQWKRASTHNGGMEFDIMEHLSGWGPYRFNQAFHWDGYGNEHKAVGSAWAYTDADKDDYITIGMLWLPGFAAYYQNGREMGRWEDERVSDTQQMIFFYMVSGGWANTPLDDDELADPKINSDFTVDYFRVWQRNDLATPADGYQPNDGNPRIQSNANPGMQVTDAMRAEAAKRNAAPVPPVR